MRAGRELAIAQGPQLAAQGLDRDRDAEVFPDPLHQTQQAPAHDAMGRRIGAGLDHLNQRAAVIVVQFGGLARRLRVNQILRTARLEAQHPIADRL
jgi:hypothetical protein